MRDLSSLKERYLRDPFEKRLGNLASDFSRLEWACSHPKESDMLSDLLRQMKHITEWIAQDAPLSIQEVMADIQPRLSMWSLIWPRLGAQPQFRNAVARESLAWSHKLLKLAGSGKG